VDPTAGLNVMEEKMSPTSATYRPRFLFRNRIVGNKHYCLSSFAVGGIY
jgi:hypothetical protein